MANTSAPAPRIVAAAAPRRMGVTDLLVDPTARSRDEIDWSVLPHGEQTGWLSPNRPPFEFRPQFHVGASCV